MDVGGVLSGLAGRAARRPVLTLVIVGALALLGALAALSLRPSAATDTLVGKSSSTYRETQHFYARFGEEPVEVLVKGDLRKLVLSSDIDRLVGLEGCLSGNLPPVALANEGGASGPCGQLRAAKSVKVVFGPGTFLGEAASQIDSSLANKSAQAEKQAAQAQATVTHSALARGLSTAEAAALGAQARKATMAGFAAEVSALAIRYGISRPPTLDDHNFVSAVVFDSTKRAGTPKQRFAYLFPGRDAALVSVRLRAGLPEAQRMHTIALIRAATMMPQWRLQNGGRYLVTGEPVIVADITGSISHSIELLLVAVLIVMAIVLGLVFAGRPRLLPLLIALLAAALTFGALALSGAALTMASVAVLPVLVGLAVDYAIQFQSRMQEEREGSDGGRSNEASGRTLAGEAPADAIVRAARRGVPAIATAVVASIGGLLVLLLSPVPMVRGFGVLLVVGVALAFVCALTAGSAAMALAGGRGGRRSGASGAGRRSMPATLLSASAAIASAWREAGEILADNPITRLVSTLALERAVRRPGRVLALGLALAALGWALDTQTHVQTDIAKLAPQDISSLHNLTALEQATGVGGEIDLMVGGSSLTKPATIEWMSRYESAILARFGYSASGGCAKAQLCPAFSLPDLFQTQAGSKLNQLGVSGLLAAVPPYFSQDVITPDRRVATLAFGIRLMSLQQQEAVIERMRAGLHPPGGVSAHLVGLSVLAAQAGAQVASPWRRVLTLFAALVAVAAILLLCFRGDPRRTLVPLIPVVLATGWSALVLFALRIPLNPMSVTLGALVIAISTEFGVLLSERQRQERAAGYSSAEAMRRAYRRTGAAVAASGVTAIAGFGVLTLSNIAMLRDFGLVTLVDLSVSLLGVLIALPAAVALVQSERPLRARLPAPGGWLAGLRLRRRGLSSP
ncbi:MAG: MMPL family transporter [Solirubrobacteraceae bacterium]